MVGYTANQETEARHPAVDGFPVNALDQDQMHETAIALVAEFGVDQAMAICHRASWRNMLKVIENGYAGR